MKILQLALVNLKRYIKTPIIFLMMLPIPLTLIFMSLNFQDSSSDKVQNTTPIAIVMEVQGQYENELVSSLDMNKSIFVGNSTDALESLNHNQFSGVFILDKNFSKDIENGIKPTITCYKVEEGGGTLLAESAIESFINDSLEKILLPDVNTKAISTVVEHKNSESTGKYSTFLIMLCYFILIAGTTLAQDIVKLRKSHILKRTLSTANKDHEILGGICLSMFLIQTLMFIIVFFIAKTLLKVENVNIPLALIVITAMSFVSTSLVLFFTRIFKNETIVNMSLIVYSLVSFMIAMAAQLPIGHSLPQFLEGIAKLFPLYWCLEIINNSVIFPGIFIMILIGLCFFTAGSFRLRDFIKD